MIICLFAVAALPPIDLTKLLQESLHAAALRIGDSEERRHRTTERITLLQQYLQPVEGLGKEQGCESSSFQLISLIILQIFGSKFSSFSCNVSPF